MASSSLKSSFCSSSSCTPNFVLTIFKAVTSFSSSLASLATLFFFSTNLFSFSVLSFVLSSNFNCSVSFSFSLFSIDSVFLINNFSSNVESSVFFRSPSEDFSLFGSKFSNSFCKAPVLFSFTNLSSKFFSITFSFSEISWMNWLLPISSSKYSNRPSSLSFSPFGFIHEIESTSPCRIMNLLLKTLSPFSARKFESSANFTCFSLMEYFDTLVANASLAMETVSALSWVFK